MDCKFYSSLGSLLMTISEGVTFSTNLISGNSNENIYITTIRHNALDDLINNTRDTASLNPFCNKARD